jgi:hypothetical protein
VPAAVESADDVAVIVTGAGFEFAVGGVAGAT